MATPVNEFDKILQAETSRTLASSSAALVLSTTTNNVFVDGSGNGTPSVINMVATPIGVYGTIVFTTSPSVTFTVDSTGKILTMNQSAMGSSDVTVTATLTTATGLVFSDSKTVKRVTIGTLGYSGALNATANNTAQGLLANRPAGANGDFYFATDNLTLYQKIGGVWTASSTIGANASNFTGTLGGDNLMWNSGFELRAQAGSNRPSGYSAYNNAGISTTYTDVAGRTGGKAFAIRANATGATNWGLYSANDIIEPDGTIGGVRGGWQANKTYIVSFKAKKVNGAGFSLPTLQWNGGVTVTQTWVNRPALSTTWQTYTVRLAWGASPEGSGHLYIDCNNGVIAINDEFHVDELIVQEGDVYSEWFPSAAEARATADNAAKSVFTPYITYDFTGTAQGWYGENSTGVTAYSNSIVVSATNNDPMLAVDNLNFSGGKYDKIRARIRRTGGSGWDGLLFYSNASHGENGSYFGLVQPDPTIGGNWTVVEWDMAKSSNYSDWSAGNVTHLRLDFGNTSSDIFEVDWISIGRYGVGSDEAMAVLSAIADDNILSKGEKSAAIAAWNAADAEWTSLLSQASALGVSSTAYDTAHSNLSSYLLSISPAWNDTTTDSAITGSIWRSKWTSYYDEKQKLLNALAAKAATLATWTGVSGSGKPADNASADVALVSTGSVTISGNSAVKTGSSGWTEQVYSRDSFAGGAYASIVAADTTGTISFGLNSASDLTDASYDSLDYSILLDATMPAVKVYESGFQVYISSGSWAVNDVFAVVYDGTNVKYLKNGTVFYTSSATIAPNQRLFFDSSLWSPGATVKNIRFGPMSSNNWANVGGSGKPADNATVGAPSGTNVGSTPATTVESNAANGQSAYNAVNDGTTGLAQRLRANAANILSGSGGLATGNLTWDSSGNRTGGYGVGINQRGIVGYNSSGNPTFTLDGSTGNATFYGALSGATGTFAGSLSAVTGTFAGTLTASQVVTTQNLVDNAATDTALVQSTSVALTGRSSSSAPSSNSDYTTLVTYSFTPSVTGVVTVHYTCFVHYTDTTGGGGTYGHDVSYIKVDIGGFSASDNTQRLNNGQFDDTFTGAKRLSVTAGVATTIYFRCSVYMANMTAVANNIEMIIEIIKK